MKFIHKIRDWMHKIIMMAKEEKIKPIIVPMDKEQLLNGKIVLITGGSSGIGFAIAEKMLESGAKVVIAGTNQIKLDSAVKRLSEGGGSVKGLIIDVRNVSDIKEKVRRAADLFDERCIDVLINSAGVVSSNDFWNTDEAEYDNIMDINAKGTFFMCQSVAKLMIERGTKGKILNITSSSALRPAWTPYQMSKWAIKGFTLGLADTLIKHGIVVNAIAPGPTATPMLEKKEGDSIFEPNNPSGRYAMPEEIASLALFMVSGAGDMIVGDTFYMTGGSGTITLHH